MSIATIASKKVCAGGSTAANTGKLGCLSLFGTPAHLIAIRKGTEIDGAEDFDLDYLMGMVQKGTMIGLIDSTAFEDVSSEDTYSTNTRGIKRLNVKGLPEYRLRFEEGHYFYKEVSKLTSFKQYDFLIGDQEGNWLIATKSNGNFQGFSAGHVTPELTKRKVEGGDPEYKSILIQFLDRLQWDRDYSIIHAEDIDFAPSDFPLVNGTEITFAAVPANTDTSLSVSVKLAADRNTLVEGLTASDFSVDVDGVTATIASVTEPTPGNYTINIPALSTGQKVIINHFSGTTNTTVANSNDVLYRNSKDNEIVVA